MAGTTPTTIEIKEFLDIEGLKHYDERKQQLSKEYTDNKVAVLANGAVKTNTDTLATLNGEGDGSIKKQIDDAFNDFATKISDDDVVNTYKELVDYCATHSAEAAEMAGDIAANKTAVTTLETFIGELPEGTNASTVIAYISEKITNFDFTEAITAAKSEAIATAATDAATKANTALSDAKAYADRLADNYATSEQGEKADTAIQNVSTGGTDGTFSVDGVDVPLKGYIKIVPLTNEQIDAIFDAIE